MQGRGITIDSEDNLYLAVDKSTNIGGSQVTVALTIKLNSSGNILWQRALAGEIPAAAAVPFADGLNIYVPQTSGGQGILSKINSLGQVIYQRKIEEPTQNLGEFAVSVAENGTMYLNTWRFGSPLYPDQGYLQISLPSDGSLYGSYKVGVAPINISLYEAIPVVSDLIETPLQSNSATASNSVTTPSSQIITNLTSQNNKIVL